MGPGYLRLGQHSNIEYPMIVPSLSWDYSTIQRQVAQEVIAAIQVSLYVMSALVLAAISTKRVSLTTTGL